jgi:hypothetical protein
MKSITLHPPGARIVFMTLYDTLSEDWLDQDLIFMRLADGSKLEVGWYGQLRTGGHFKIVRYLSSWHEPQEVVRTKKIDDVITTIQRLAVNASARNIRVVSTSKAEYHPVSWVPL